MVNTQRIRISAFILGCAFSLLTLSHEEPKPTKQNPFNEVSGTWAQKTLATLTIDEKIGQLFMIAAVSDEAANASFMFCEDAYTMDTHYVQTMIKNYHVGGIIFLGSGTAETHYAATQAYQQLSKIPLLIGLDAEWGLSMRLGNTVQFPRNMTLGTLADESLIYAMATEIARQATLLGTHIIFAPVFDVNNNPLNPVIGSRSFGSDKYAVARKGILFQQGLQDHGIIGCAKHFPGHGNTAIDSHYDLPYIQHSLQELTNTELYPFTQSIDAGIQAVMTAHLEVPALETEPQCPTSLSYNTVTSILRKDLGFNGLVITDALGMHGITKHYSAGDSALKAIKAGNDILLCSTNIPAAHARIKQALSDGTLSHTELDEHVYRILRAKEWAFSKSHPHTLPTLSLATVNSEYAYKLKQHLYTQAITIARDNNSLIPLNQHIHHTVHHIHYGHNNTNTAFTQTLTAQNNLSVNTITTPLSADAIEKTLATISPTDILVISISDMNKFYTQQFGLTNHTIQSINALAENHIKTIVVIFGSPYSMPLFDNAPTIIMAYEDDPDAQQAAVHTLIGSHKATGSLPI